MYRPDGESLNNDDASRDARRQATEHNRSAPKGDASAPDAFDAYASGTGASMIDLLADRQTADRLGSALSAPGPSEAFVDSLGERLQTEFALIHADGFQNQSQPKDASSQAEPVAVAGRTNEASDRRGLSAARRWWTAAAASVLIATFVWSGQSSYSWAGMLHAVRQQQWSHSELLRSGVVRVRRWASSAWVRGEGGVAAQGGDDGLRYLDRSRGEEMAAPPGAPQITRAPLAAGVPPNGAEGISWLLEDLLGDDADQWRHVDDSWRDGARHAGRSDLVNLTVVFRSPSGERASLDFVVDPKTGLPLTASRQGRPDKIRFAFGDKGPKSIYDLGADRSLPVVEAARVAARSSAAQGAVSLRAGKSFESTRISELDRDQQTIPPPLPGGRSPLNQPPNHVDDSAGAVSPEVIDRTVRGLNPNGAGNPAAQIERGPWSPLPATPAEPPLSDTELTNRVDELLRGHWASTGVEPVGPASDEELLRRMQLDLTGRIPTVGEVRIFLEDSGPGRRERLVDALLDSRDHATHFASMWRRALIPRGVDLAPYGGPAKLEAWLADHVQRNTPHSQLARELLTAEGRLRESGPLLFYAALKLNPEELAAQTARTFLGMRLECAECHDHPFDERISQEDFWAFAANFARISRPKGMIETTPDILRVHDTDYGDVTLPGSEAIVAPGLPLTDRPVLDAADWPSRREQMTHWITAPQNHRFARATVNRVWSHLFGRPLVDPIDDIRDDSEQRVPGVLDAIADDFARSGHDMRRLVRCLVMTKAYQLSSEAPAEEPQAVAAANRNANAHAADRTEVFARMNIKPFTAEQLHDAIAVASRNAAAGRGTAAGGLVRFGDTNRDAFIRLFEAPGDNAIDYQAGIPQALTMMHGRLIHGATDITTSGMLRSLSAPFFTDQQRIEQLFLATLSRYPTDTERQTMQAHVSAATDRAGKQQKLGDVLWALLNSAEFTLNH